MTAAELAELRAHTQACEIFRAHGRGEDVDAAVLAAATEIVERAAQPASSEEQAHADAMFLLVAEATRMHKIVFPERFAS